MGPRSPCRLARPSGLNTRRGSLPSSRRSEPEGHHPSEQGSPRPSVPASSAPSAYRRQPSPFRGYPSPCGTHQRLSKPDGRPQLQVSPTKRLPHPSSQDRPAQTPSPSTPRPHRSPARPRAYALRTSLLACRLLNRSRHGTPRTPPVGGEEWETLTSAEEDEKSTHTMFRRRSGPLFQTK